MIRLLTWLGLLMVAGGPFGAHQTIFSPLLGFGITGAGLALLALLFFVGIMRGNRIHGKAVSGNGGAVFFGFLALLAIGALVYFSLPHPINDITSDFKNPPAFRNPAFPVKVGKGAEYLDPALQLNRAYNPEMEIPQMSHYPPLESLVSNAAAQDVYAETLKTIRRQFPQWRLVLDDPGKAHAEFEVESPVFRFIDDVVVEVRFDPKQSGPTRVDFRSRSRVGKGDLGVNYARLKELRAVLAESLKSLPPTPSAPTSAPLPATSTKQEGKERP